MKQIGVNQIITGDGVRVRNRHLSFCGRVIKVNRVNFKIASSVFGHPVEYDVRKTDCVGGQVDRNGTILDITTKE